MVERKRHSKHRSPPPKPQSMSGAKAPGNGRKCSWCHEPLSTNPTICPNCFHFQQRPLFYLQSLGGLIVIVISLLALIVSYMQVETAKDEVNRAMVLAEDTARLREQVSGIKSWTEEFAAQQSTIYNSRYDSLNSALDRLGADSIIDERLILLENEERRLREEIGIISSKSPSPIVAPAISIFGGAGEPNIIGEYRCNGSELELNSYGAPFDAQAIKFFSDRAPSPLSAGGCKRLADLNASLAETEGRIANLMAKKTSEK